MIFRTPQSAIKKIKNLVTLDCCRFVRVGPLFVFRLFWDNLFFPFVHGTNMAQKDVLLKLRKPPGNRTLLSFTGIAGA